MNNKYLINEPPLLILPSLAKTIGLNEAILLQQIHYWLQTSKHEKGGYKWIYNTYAQWLKQFPFWSESTLKRTVKKLENKEIIVTVIEITENINKTKWYRIDYDILNQHTGLSPDIPNSSNLIIDDYPLMFQPSLAIKYGLNGAIFLQQLHYWLTYNSKERDNRLWVVHKYSQWLEQFSFWSKNTLIKTIDDLFSSGAIESTNKYNSSLLNNLRWLSINYEVINSQPSKNNKPNTGIEPTSTKIDMTSTKSDITSTSSDITDTKTDPTNTDNELTNTRNELQNYQICPDSVPELTSCHIYTETNTEITETTADEVSPENILGKNPFQMIPESKIIELIKSSFSTAVENYKKLIDSSKAINANDSRYQAVRSLLERYGENAVDNLFDNVRKSDFLLGHAGNFKPAFSWLLKNAEKIISGEYESDGDSLYEKAQKCCNNNENCETALNRYMPPRPHCKYCEQFLNRDKIPKKTEAEIEEELFQKCKAKDYCVVKKLKMKTPLSYCNRCPKNDFTEKISDAHLKAKAEECYKNCSGCCSVKVMKTEPLDYCKFCPSKPDDPDRMIKANPADSEAVWKAAYRWADSNDKKISGFIEDFEIYSTYSASDYKQEVLIVVYEVMQELLADFNGCAPVSKFEERIWNNFRYRFRKGMQTVPAMRDIFKDGNKSACEFLDYEELREIISDQNDTEPKNASLAEEILQTLFGILTVREEEVLDYVLGFSKGKHTQSEAALIMGTTRDNVAMLQKKAVDKIISFCKEHQISAASSLETIKFKIRTYQKQQFKDPCRYRVFEIGSLINQIAG